MSLDDMLHDHDGSVIGIIDGVLLHLNGKIASAWQNKTCRSKKDLEKMLYLASAGFFGSTFVNTQQISSALVGTSAALKATYESLRPRAEWYDPNHFERSAVSGNFQKYLGVGGYYLGGAVSLFGIGYLVEGTLTRDNEACTKGLYGITVGLGLLCLASADYISRVDVGAPPPKKDKKSVLEKVKETVRGLLSRPSLEPAPVKNRIGSDYYPRGRDFYR